MATHPEEREVGEPDLGVQKSTSGGLLDDFSRFYGEPLSKALDLESWKSGPDIEEVMSLEVV